MINLTTDNISALSKERSDRLRRLRNLANLTRKDLCEGAGININTYIGYEVGKYGGITKKGANKVVGYLEKKGVYSTIEWLMTGCGLPPTVTTDFQSNINITENINLSLRLPNCDQKEESKISEEISLFYKHYANATGLLVNDDGMSPKYDEGDYVAGIRKFGSDIDDLVGLDCIVQTLEENFFVRTLSQGRVGSCYTLLCINPKTNVDQPVIYDVSLISAASIIWHRRPKVSDNDD